MATISTNKAGQRRILFVDSNKKRRAIYLGKVKAKYAEQVKSKVEAIVSARLVGAPIDGETARWVRDLDDVLHEKLVAVGLVSKRERIRLGPFAHDYITKRNDVKTASKTVWRQGEKSLVDYFTADRPVESVTAADTEDYKQHLIGTNLAPYTVRKRLQFAKMIVNALKTRSHIPSNPFSAVQMAAVVDESRNVFVTREDAKKIMDAAPDAEWRAIIALSRFAGLRCPSETLSLKWDHIDWAKQRITVISPKTAHRQGGGQRIVPQFDDLLDPLREAFEAAPVGSVYVVERYRHQASVNGDWRNCNLRTGLQRILKRAGVLTYPKPFHALRASCETELVEKVPVQTAAAWLGNSPKVALKHYLRVLPEHFDRVTRNTPMEATPAIEQVLRRDDAPNDARQAPHGADSSCTISQSKNHNPDFAGRCDKAPHNTKPIADGVGFEPTLRLLVKRFSRPSRSSTPPPIRLPEPSCHGA